MAQPERQTSSRGFNVSRVESIPVAEQRKRVGTIQQSVTPFERRTTHEQVNSLAHFNKEEIIASLKTIVSRYNRANECGNNDSTSLGGTSRLREEHDKMDIPIFDVCKSEEALNSFTKKIEECEEYVRLQNQQLVSYKQQYDVRAEVIKNDYELAYSKSHLARSALKKLNEVGDSLRDAFDAIDIFDHENPMASILYRELLSPTQYEQYLIVSNRVQAISEKIKTFDKEKIVQSQLLDGLECISENKSEFLGIVSKNQDLFKVESLNNIYSRVSTLYEHHNNKNSLIDCSKESQFTPELKEKLAIFYRVNLLLYFIEPDYSPLDACQYEIIKKCIDLKDKINNIHSKRIKGQNAIKLCLEKNNDVIVQIDSIKNVLSASTNEQKYFNKDYLAPCLIQLSEVYQCLLDNEKYHTAEHRTLFKRIHDIIQTSNALENKFTRNTSIPFYCFELFEGAKTIKLHKKTPTMLILNQMMNNEIRRPWNIMHFLNFAAGLELRNTPIEQRFALKIIDFLATKLNILQDSNLASTTKAYYCNTINCFLSKLKHNTGIRHSSSSELPKVVRALAEPLTRPTVASEGNVLLAGDSSRASQAVLPSHSVEKKLTPSQTSKGPDISQANDKTVHPTVRKKVSLAETTETIEFERDEKIKRAAEIKSKKKCNLYVNFDVDIAPIQLTRITDDEYKTETGPGFDIQLDNKSSHSTIPTVIENRNNDSIALSLELKKARERAPKTGEREKKIQQKIEEIIAVIPDIQTRETAKNLIYSFSEQVIIVNRTDKFKRYSSVTRALDSFDIVSNPITLQEAYERYSPVIQNGIDKDILLVPTEPGKIQVCLYFIDGGRKFMRYLYIDSNSTESQISTLVMFLIDNHFCSSYTDEQR